MVGMFGGMQTCYVADTVRRQTQLVGHVRFYEQCCFECR